MKTLVNRYSYFWISLVLIFIDQLSKYFIRKFLDVGEVIKVTKKLVWITNIQNTGAAFSFSFGSHLLNKIIFIIITIAAIVLIIYLFNKSKTKIEKVTFAMILGGALGNLIDRILLGSVTDFIWCDFPDVIMIRWPVFNIADSCIVIAIILMMVYTLFHRKETVEDR
ncbi:MAG: signal peptidase II [Candidatus Cloacimonetes bacterium]|nr:signal peptidase II [Candidatus Cloacimonadota bacterium]